MHNHDRRPSTCATSRPHRAASRPARGQALIETAIGIVLLLLLTFSIVDAAMLFYTYLTLENGVTEATRFAVTGQQTSDPANPTTALSREDSIKRVMRSSTPGLEIPDREFRFDADTRLVLSVVQLGAGGPNANKPVITQRHAAGMPTGASLLGEPPSSSYGGGPAYTANNPATDTSIQARSPLPNGLQLNPGQSLYVAEIWVKRRDIMPLAGVRLPDTLYSIAYF